MNKRGQGLPLTTIIIAILVILVLVIVVVFFLGGFRGISEKTKEMFSKTVEGIDITLAVESCQSYCEQSKMLPKNLVENSAYCSLTFNIDMDNNGEAEKDDGIYIDYHCWRIGVMCEGIYEDGKEILCKATDRGSREI